jgi:hypothetical protein
MRWYHRVTLTSIKCLRAMLMAESPWKFLILCATSVEIQLPTIRASTKKNGDGAAHCLSSSPRSDKSAVKVYRIQTFAQSETDIERLNTIAPVRDRLYIVQVCNAFLRVFAPKKPRACVTFSARAPD